MARPERVELPTFWFVARRSIQLSYGRAEVANAIEIDYDTPLRSSTRRFYSRAATKAKPSKFRSRRLVKIVRYGFGPRNG